MNENSKKKFRTYMAALARFKALQDQFGDAVEARGKPLAELVDARIDFEAAASLDFNSWSELPD